MKSGRGSVGKHSPSKGIRFSRGPEETLPEALPTASLAAKNLRLGAAGTANRSTDQRCKREMAVSPPRNQPPLAPGEQGEAQSEPETDEMQQMQVQPATEHEAKGKKRGRFKWLRCLVWKKAPKEGGKMKVSNCDIEDAAIRRPPSGEWATRRARQSTQNWRQASAAPAPLWSGLRPRVVSVAKEVWACILESGTDPRHGRTGSESSQQPSA
jgi:hypothetical protein